MNNDTSSTGISHLNKSNMTEALIFGDDTCPRCGYHLKIDTKWLKGEQVRVRYICDRCGFVCPMKHDGDNISPTYDRSVFNFLSNFGKDIRERILDIKKRSFKND